MIATPSSSTRYTWCTNAHRSAATGSSGDQRAGRDASDFLLYSWAGYLHYRAQLGAGPFFIEEGAGRTLPRGSPVAVPGAGAAPAAAVCAAARVPLWLAAVVGQGGLRPRVGGAARRSHAPLL